MEWTRGPTIGRGSNATVSIAAAHSSGHLFAVKSAKLSQSQFLKREQKILSTLSCPQIIAYKGFDITSENGDFVYNLFMEFAPHGSLTDEISAVGRRVDEATIRFLTREILLGLDYLHSNGVVHCDIKGPNILLAGDGVKIADLGCARLVSDRGSASIAGTPVYMAPEVARGEQQGFPADVWALGCTVIEMATGRVPWADVCNPVSALYRIGFSGEAPEVPRFMSEEAKDFLSNCLMRDPEKRWSASELLKHRFLEEPKIISKEINRFKSDSPISVLNQDFWDSMEELETQSIQDQTHKSTLSSPWERIKQLSGVNTASFSKIPNWTLDENWVTVRSNGIKEPEFSCCQDSSSLYETNRNSRGRCTVCVCQDCILQCSNEPRTGTLMSCERRRNVIMSGNLDFDKKNENFVFCSVKYLLYYYFTDPNIVKIQNLSKRFKFKIYYIWDKIKHATNNDNRNIQYEQV